METTDATDLNDWFLPAFLPIVGTCVVYVFTRLQTETDHISHDFFLGIANTILIVIMMSILNASRPNGQSLAHHIINIYRIDVAA